LALSFGQIVDSLSLWSYLTGVEGSDIERWDYALAVFCREPSLTGFLYPPTNSPGKMGKLLDEIKDCRI
jgi:hypothetical protein